MRSRLKTDGHMWGFPVRSVTNYKTRKSLDELQRLVNILNPVLNLSCDMVSTLLFLVSIRPSCLPPNAKRTWQIHGRFKS